PTSPPPPPPAPPESGARAVSSNGGPPPEHLIGIPQDVSSWVQYLPAVFSEDEFLKRFLLIFEAIHAPHEWIVDNFDCYLDPDLTPPEWLRWFGSWCDILIPGTIPLERQRAVGRELGPLFLARGTRRSLTRHLELVFGVEPNIEEPPDRDATFVVRLPLGKDNDTLANRDVADQIINAQRPVHTNYELHIT
ncbi:MAG: hypothetical protein GYB66_14090, partial [Chloroflexi bacterium]|nr:hypothetical protein [Chloroflexota bacterium]